MVMTMNETKVEIVKLDDKKIVTKEIEQKDGLTFMRMKSRRLK